MATVFFRFREWESDDELGARAGLADQSAAQRFDSLSHTAQAGSL